MDASDPMIWPVHTRSPHFAQHSINLIDCQDGVLDFRNLNFWNSRKEQTTVIYHRCLLIFGDAETTWITTQYIYDTTMTFPCNVRCSLKRCLIRHASCVSLLVMAGRKGEGTLCAARCRVGAVAGHSALRLVPAFRVGGHFLVRSFSACACLGLLSSVHLCLRCQLWASWQSPLTSASAIGDLTAIALPPAA